MSCDSTYPADPLIACDVTWTHSGHHENSEHGVSWTSKPPMSESTQRRLTTLHVKRAWKESQR